MRRIRTVYDAEELSVEDVRKLVDLRSARAIYDDPQYNPAPNGRAPHVFRSLSLGTWRLSMFGEASVLVRIPIRDFRPSEGDWDHALAHWSTQNYIRWMEEGIEPPPLHVCRAHSGRLISMNRRRWLAARAAGWDSLKCWYDPSSDVYTGRSRWYFPEWNEAKVNAYWIWRDQGEDPRRSLDAHEVECIERFPGVASRPYALGMAEVAGPSIP